MTDETTSAGGEQTFAGARRDLDQWWRDRPIDPYGTDAALRSLNRRYLPSSANAPGDGPARAGRLAELESAAEPFGRAVMSEIAEAASRYEHRSHLPELERFDAFGHEIEAVRFDPDYHRAGRAVWAGGIVAHSGEPGRAFEQATLLYLLSLEGETGHACPATCTIGLARALRRRADAEVRDRFLPPLLERDYDRAERASQFLTEVQGGSDVGANATVAEPQPDGSWLLSGEKWFCSVADADQFLVTARVAGGSAGTKGLGCFVAPRTLDGAPNGFRLRRLKEKLGTRGLASGELDLVGARAWPVGPVDQGFKTAVSVVLNTSRWATAVGGAGMMRRAYLEARSFARHRRAFGRPIEGFPLVRTTLARMKAEWLGALHAVWLLTECEDAIDSGGAGEATVLLHRFLVNATKFHVSLGATAVVRDAIEVLGGNGTIEEFSVLPRLYRDAIVYESWEGTHNVLCAQVLNDCRRLDLLGTLGDTVSGMLRTTGAPAGFYDHAAAAAAVASRALAEDLDGARRSIGDPAYGDWHFRGHLARLLVATEIGALVSASAFAGGSGDSGLAVELGAAADLIARAHLDPTYRPHNDKGLSDRVAAVLGEE